MESEVRRPAAYRAAGAAFGAGAGLAVDAALTRHAGVTLSISIGF
jgi:hypothetical protein